MPASIDAVAAPEPRAAGRPTATIRVGLVGCGAFARFSMARYRALPGVTIQAVADIDSAAAQRAALELEADVLAPETLLVAPDVDLVYIATPPATHFRQARLALEAGKHVLVEKPLATTVADAETLAVLAEREGRCCVANLVERYSPLADAVRDVIGSGLLGDLVHGLFVNDAADEGLGPRHWFWNRSVSGGIFVEHGVHFFDLVASWLGPGEVVAAARSVRPPRPGHRDGCDAAVEEQVMCVCRYAPPGAACRTADAACGDGDGDGHAGVLFHFEHGFHQPSRMDRQEMRLVFERGELRLFDWVPTHGELRALLDDAAAATLADILPAASIRTVERYEGDARHVRGRFRGFDASGLVEITFSVGTDKLGIYGDVVHDLAADQIAWIRDPAHRRRLTEADSVASVAMACAADRMALAAG
jgi:predicted dehydrogenase